MQLSSSPSWHLLLLVPWWLQVYLFGVGPKLSRYLHVIEKQSLNKITKQKPIAVPVHHRLACD
jgi:hypothetical protein